MFQQAFSISFNKPMKALHSNQVVSNEMVEAVKLHHQKQQANEEIKKKALQEKEQQVTPVYNASRS